MWMMGYNEAEDLNINMMESYANNGSRKLRPLVPRPTCAAASSSNRFHSTHHDHLLPNHHHHHHLVAAEHHKREFNSQQMVVVSSRWNPTPEQLQTLEELYRRGTRTPSADEIQHITAQLRRYGKIEGKNVFYWFQNHKARERQKRRRQLDNPTTDLHQPPYYTTTDINTINIDLSTERKDSELNRTSYEVEETRNWAIPTFSEKVLRERTSKTESRVTSMADQGRVAVEQEEEDEGNDQLLLLHRRRKSYPEKNATWKHMMQCLSSSTPPTNHNSTITTTCTPATPSVPKTSSFLVVSPNSQRHHFHHDVDSFQTLELFPVTSNGHGREQSEKCFFPTNDVSISPRQFIEFLPLKN